MTNKITLGEKVSYAMLNFGQSLLTTLISTYILYYYTDILLIPAAIVSLLLFIVRFFDGAIDPFIGFYMDKRTPKTGKFLGYFKFWTVPFCVLAVLLFMPFGFQLKGTVILCFFVYILWSFAASMVESAGAGLSVSVTADSAERRKMNTFKIVASVLAVFIVSYFTLIFVDRFNIYSQGKGYFYTALLFALAALCCMIPGLIIIKERNFISTNKFNFNESVALLSKNKKLIFVLLMHFSHQIASNLKTQTVIYYFKYALGQIEAVSVYFLAGRLGSLAAQPVIVFLAGKYKTSYLMITGYAIAASSMVLTAFFSRSAVLMILFGFLSSVGSAFPANLVYPYMAEIADDISAEANTSLSGTVSSLLGLTARIGISIAGALIALIFHISSYSPNIQQTAAAMLGIRICFMGLTAFMYGLSAFWAYKSYKKGQIKTKGDL